MDKVKGIVFLIESLLKSSKKQLLSNKLVVDSNEIFSLINKLNDALLDHEKNNDQRQLYQANDIAINTQDSELMDAKKQVLKLKQDANEYADSILSRLQLIVTKLQKNVIKIEKNISEGRRLIEEKQLAYIKGETHETE